MPGPDQAGVPVLDEKVLAELSASVQGDRTFLVELINAYLADGLSHVDAIGAAVAQDDSAALIRPAHTLKSSSATVGASRLAATSRALEMAGRAGSIGPDERVASGGLQTEWEAAAAALRAWVGGGGAE